MKKTSITLIFAITILLGALVSGAYFITRQAFLDDIFPDNQPQGMQEIQVYGLWTYTHWAKLKIKEEEFLKWLGSFGRDLEEVQSPSDEATRIKTRCQSFFTKTGKSLNDFSKIYTYPVEKAVAAYVFIVPAQVDSNLSEVFIVVRTRW